ncbi:flagellar protein FlaG [Alteromonas pelagimontana]|uniref:Flagellar protein FlaG n=1 Tax=Alteromonas pelagimontana TaxID=1858656 RepID=A0A6M4MGT8_9ALTE|nr:flagellar protein FlaG [Alteromonas pelagimontana]QJR81820.1 flagellar protein FlaG [Alteromonas pelagimontana]
MEIAKAQVGHTFAHDMVRSSVPQVEKTLISSAGNADQKVDVSKDTLSQKNVQVNSVIADKEASEGKQLDVETAAQAVEAFLQVQSRNLSFTIDKETQRSVVTVRDSESGNIIRQIPSEEVLKLAERIKELQEDVGSSVGVLLNNRV